MKVKELIDTLQKFNPELDVWVQRDPEGNSFSPLGGSADDGVVMDDGEIYSNEWTSHEACIEDPVEWDLLKEKNQCVVVFPLY